MRTNLEGSLGGMQLWPVGTRAGRGAGDWVRDSTRVCSMLPAQGSHAISAIPPQAKPPSTHSSTSVAAKACRLSRCLKPGWPRSAASPPPPPVSSAVRNRSSRAQATSRPAAHSFCAGAVRGQLASELAGGAQPQRAGADCARAHRRSPAARHRAPTRKQACLEVAAGTHTQRRTQHRYQRVVLGQRQVDGAACRGWRWRRQQVRDNWQQRKRESANRASPKQARIPCTTHPLPRTPPARRPPAAARAPPRCAPCGCRPPPPGAA